MKHIRLSTASALIGLVCTTPVWATLGESAASIQADASHLGSSIAAMPATSPSLFTVQRMTLPNSARVDEFVSASGTVFAVNWRGPRPPDLSQLLGSYFAEYQTAATQPHVRSSHVVINTSHITYRAGGHMRDYWGGARIPALIPAGVTEGDLR